MMKLLSPVLRHLEGAGLWMVQALLGLLCALSPVSIEIASAQQKLEVKVGVILPLTGSTDMYGTEARRILELMTPVINARSKKYHYRFILEDGRCGGGNAAITAAHKLLEIDSVQFMLVGCSGEILQTAKLFNSQEMITMSLFGSHPDVKTIGGYVFRTYPDADTGVQGLYQVIQSRGYKRVALITEEVSFTEGRRELMESLLGDRLIVNETFRADDQSLRSIVTKAKAANVEVVYLNAASPQSHQSLLRQVRQLNLEAALLANEAAGDRGSLTDLGELQEGLIFISAAVSTPILEPFAEIMRGYRARFHSDGEFPTIMHSTYNSLIALSSVIEASGVNSDAVRQALASWSGTGSTGDLRFDRNQDLIGSAFELQVIRQGIPVSGIDSGPKEVGP